MKLKETRFYKWLDNFFYHYKWIVLIVCMFAIFVVVSAAQMLGREQTDIYIMYAGPQVISVQNMTYIERAFEELDEDDYTGDGKVNALLRDITVMSEEELAAASGSSDSNVPNEGYILNEQLVRAQMSESMKTFNQEILGGDSIICLLSPYMYSIVREADGFLPLDEVIGYVPENAYDECAVYLADTDFGKLEGLASLPDDTLFCIRRVSSMSFMKGKNKTEKAHSYHLERFKAAIEYIKETDDSAA